MTAEVLSDQRTVPRCLVHRSSVHEVFLTDSREIEAAADTFAVAAQWPRRHIMSDGGPREQVADALLVESIRQVGLYLPHRYRDVPVGFVFVATQLGFEWLRPDRPQFGDAPLAVDMSCQLSDAATTRPSRRGFWLTTVIQIDGQICASGSGELTCLSPALYARVRRARSTSWAAETATPADPATVGRSHQDQVALGAVTFDAEPRSLSAEVVIDHHHPFFFDHQYDHLPASLLIEAAEQAALALRPTSVVSDIDARFASYAELDAAVRVTAAANAGTGKIAVTIWQSGRVLANIAVGLTPHGGDGDALPRSRCTALSSAPSSSAREAATTQSPAR